MPQQKILSDIREFFTKNSDEARQKKYAYYFKEGFDSYGIPQEIFMVKKDEWYEKHLKSVTFEDIVNFGIELLKSGKYEEGNLAIMYLIKRKKELKNENFSDVTSWLDWGLTNWAHVDFFSSKVIGVYLNKNHAQLKDLSSWRKAESKWKRRATPVSMLNILKMEHDVNDLLAFIDCMMDDKERVVHQGLGWFLRECWKKHPEEVELFLHKWKNTAARLIFQYATGKNE